MRFLFGLLLVLVLVPAGGFVAPCCAAEPSEACCPLDRDCAADEGACPAAVHAVATIPVATPPPVALPAVEIAFLPVVVDPAPPCRAVRATRCLPLRN